MGGVLASTQQYFWLCVFVSVYRPFLPKEPKRFRLVFRDPDEGDGLINIDYEVRVSDSADLTVLDKMFRHCFATSRGTNALCVIVVVPFYSGEDS